LNEIRPTAIFAQLDAVNILAGIAGTIAGTPKIVFSFRNVNPTNFSYLRNEWFLPAYRVLVKNPGIILSGNSRAGNDDYAEWIGVPPERVKYVGNAIENGIGPLPVGPADIIPSVASILGVFRLSEEKRPLLFLDICEQVKSVVPSLQVLIAGVGPMQAELTAEIRKRGVSDYVKLLGRRNDVLKLMQLSSLLLLTSVFEGTPNVVLEAQALGLPVVATSVGGIPDVVINGETGFLTGVNGKEALVQACIRILSDECLRTRMGEAAKSHVAKLFSLKSMTDNYIKLLEDVSSRAQ